MMASMGTTDFQHVTSCPICGEPLILHGTYSDVGDGRVLAKVDDAPVYEHTCPDRAGPYDGILGALGPERPSDQA